MKKSTFILAILYCLLSAVGCSSNQENLLAGRWKVESYADPSKATMGATSVSSDETYSLQLDDHGRFWFTTDCNTISGEYNVDARHLQFENLSATELACDHEIVERSIKTQLPMVVSYDLPDDSTLCLLGRQGNILVRLVRATN